MALKGQQFMSIYFSEHHLKQKPRFGTFGKDTHTDTHKHLGFKGLKSSCLWVEENSVFTEKLK